MTFQQLINQFLTGLQSTSYIEGVAVVFGIISVLYSRKENILVYPTGIINTILFIYLCFSWKLYAEASLNFYYTIVSIYGWYAWLKPNQGKVLSITKSNTKEWLFALSFFICCWVVLYFVLIKFTQSTVPIPDSFASAAAYTAMILMARKKLEHWLWWTITNLASIPLYFYKAAVFTSVQYIVFLALSIAGWIEWNKKQSMQVKN